MHACQTEQAWAVLLAHTLQRAVQVGRLPILLKSAHVAPAGAAALGGLLLARTGGHFVFVTKSPPASAMGAFLLACSRIGLCLVVQSPPAGAFGAPAALRTRSALHQGAGMMLHSTATLRSRTGPLCIGALCVKRHFGMLLLPLASPCVLVSLRTKYSVRHSCCEPWPLNCDQHLPVQEDKESTHTDANAVRCGVGAKCRKAVK